MKIRWLTILPIMLLLCLSWLTPLSVVSAAGDIYVARISGSINPGSADYIVSSIDKASQEKAVCVIIELDTPGGLVESMRTIVKAIYASEIPVIVYITPEGARAASAGVMITMAADIAAMAPGTNIGAAHPVSAGGKDIDGDMAEKISNDMAAYIRSIAEKRRRNAEWAEKAVRESVSATATEALELKVIDLIAHNREELLQSLEGRNIEGKTTLTFKSARIIELKENLRTKLLKTISDPNIAYILMMLGLAGLYFEISHPGSVLPGVVGAICLVLAFFAFETLPVNYAGFLLILLSGVFFMLEIKITSFGLLSLAGIVSLVIGSMMLYDSQDPAMKLSLAVFFPTILMISLFFILVVWLVIKSQTAKTLTGEQGLIGEIGVVRQAVNPEGKIFIHGELWRAVSPNSPLPLNTAARVVKVEGLTLYIEPVSQRPRPQGDGVPCA